MTTTELSRTIAESAAATSDYTILQQPQVGAGDWRNELVLFIKPEAFLDKTPEQSARIAELVLQKLQAFDAHVAGAVLIGGPVLDRLEIMSEHYGLINRLSRTASQMIGAEDRQKVADALGIALDGYDLLGGHEYLAQYPNETSQDLDTLWFESRSSKIRSGFYVKPATKDGRNIVLVNAFHPEQLRHFTDASHRIALFLIHSNTAWGTLRNEMVGATFPDKADPGSMRGTFYANPAEYGFESVSIANNVVHLSAGPFEGLFEISNFLGKIMKLDITSTQPQALKQLLAAGLTEEQALGALKNPIISETPKPTDLFTATEDVDTPEAVALYKQFVTSAA